MSTQLDTIETMMKDIKEDVKEIHGAVYGNGKDGLLTRVSGTEKGLRTIYYISGVIFVAMTGLVGKLVYDVIKHAC